MPYKVCAVPLCKNNSRNVKHNDKVIIFHGFPRDAELNRQWYTFCRQDANWRPSPCSTICSEHFKAEDYQLHQSPLIKDHKNYRVLKITAVPSVVESNQTLHIYRKQLKEKRKHKINALSKPAADSEVECIQTSHRNVEQLKEEPADSESNIDDDNLYDPLENAHQSKLNGVEEVIKALESENDKLVTVNLQLRLRLKEFKDENDKLKEESKRIKKELENNYGSNLDKESY